MVQYETSIPTLVTNSPFSNSEGHTYNKSLSQGITPENELIKEQLRELRNDDEKKKQNDKQDRIEASIKQREEAVRAAKEEIEKDRRKERGVHLHDKAVENFKALLTDMVS